MSPRHVAASIGFVILVGLAFMLFGKLTECGSDCQAQRAREENQRQAAAERARQSLIPPLPPHSNASDECPGVVTEQWEQPGGLRKFPTGGPRGNWMGDFHKNPCAVYYLIQDGMMQFATDAGLGMYGWQEGSPARTDWPVTIDAVGSALNKPSKWTYILCRQWHPVMKEWRCR